jgi:hypothetical protein
VFEVDHLEFLPPYAKTSLMHYNFSKDGITDITCLNTHQNFRLKNDPTYWNPQLKDEFMGRVTKLWDESYYQEGVGKFHVEKNAK